MKKNLINLIILALVFTGACAFFSCESELFDTDTSVAVDNAIVEAIFADEQNISDQASEGKLDTYIPGIESGILSQCATVTLDMTSTPKKITVDFGTTNCTCADGRDRRGKIIVTFTGGYRDSGTVVTHSFEDYYVNDYQVTGTKVVVNAGKNTAGNWNYTIDIDAKIFKPTGDSIIWISTRNNEWIQGDSTVTWLDDVYLITGSGNGVTASGVAFDIEITKALRKEIGYKHLTEGTIELTPAGKATRIIDYGDGTQDNKATVTIRNKTFNIILG